MLHIALPPPDVEEPATEDGRTGGRSSSGNVVHRPGETAKARPRSLSPPGDEDFLAIASEAAKWAEGRTVVSSKLKEVADATKESELISKGMESEDAEWVVPLATTDYESTDPVYLFNPAVSDAAELPPSGITKLLNSNGPSGRSRMMHLKVFCPFLFRRGEKMTPVPVRIHDHGNVVDVIKATLRVVRDTDLPTAKTISTNPELYRLRVAEDDSGRPDEDLPVLDKKTSLRRMGFDTLVLCVTGNVIGTVAPMVTRQTSAKTLEDISVRVFYGTGGKRHKRVALPPDMMFKDAAQVVCDRFKRETAKHHLRILLDGAEKDSLGEDHVPLGDRTIGVLSRVFGVKDMYLKAKTREEDDPYSDSDVETPGSAASPVKMFCDWDEASASRYTEYNIIKINKFGSRQRRILGIDREKIYNMMAGSKAQKTKNPERSIHDVILIRTFDDKPCYFEVEYRNSKSGKDQIECQSPIDAHEIATKVRFLLELHRATQLGTPQAAGGPERKSAMPISGMDKFLALIAPQKDVVGG
ncbi:Ras-interacting protein RIP3 [Diplonema papillatum]|nr:Ras-interacting protein RIP3 [Diplonema papillatum]